MRPRHVSALVVLTGLSVASVGCDVPRFNISAWPSHAQRGGLVGLPVDSNLNPLSRGESYDLSSRNVTVELEWTSGSTTHVLTVAAVDVMEVWAAPETLPLAALNFFISDLPHPETRAWVAIAVFEVPDLEAYPAGTVFPLDVTVRPLRDGAPIAHPTQSASIEAPLRILDADFDGNAGGSFAPTASELEPPPLLRVVGVADPASFDPQWFDGDPANGELRIGSVEFELEHPGAAPEAAYGTGQAAQATALLGAGGGAGLTRVLLVAPEGFRLPPHNPSSTQAGDGPFLDLVFAPGSLFVPSDFTIRDLRVTDLEGNPILDAPGNAGAHVGLYARGAE